LVLLGALEQPPQLIDVVEAPSPTAFGGFDYAFELDPAAPRERSFLLASVDADDEAFSVHARRLRPGGLQPGYGGKTSGNQLLRRAA
jgi:hypothetical protein